MPPFKSIPFPVAIDRPAICGRESGRDSKITKILPKGTVTCFKNKPSETIVFFKHRFKIVFDWFATKVKPSERVFSFSGVNLSRESNAGESPRKVNYKWSVLKVLLVLKLNLIKLPEASAFIKSFILTSNISDCLV